MITTILRAHNSPKEKIKHLALYLLRRRVAKKAWKKRHRIVFDRHPEFKGAAVSATIRKHLKIWSAFDKGVDLSTLDICCATSGKQEPQIIPEEIFQADIEPSLNRYSTGHYLSHKSLYNRWFGDGLFPENLLHLIDGELLEGDLNPVTKGQAELLAEQYEYPVIVKPNFESYGGSDILIADNPTELLTILTKSDNLVVQKVLRQNSQLGVYHPESLNTVRVYLYKSVRDNTTHIVNMAFRTGILGRLDNVSTGGLVSRINDEGYLHGYALDRYGARYEKHPVSGIPFNRKIQDFDELKKLSTGIAQKLFQLRVVGLDLCYDHTGTWRAIEINTKGHSIRFAQYAGVPFFGEHTREVVEYCKNRHWTLE